MLGNIINTCDPILDLDKDKNYNLQLIDTNSSKIIMNQLHMNLNCNLNFSKTTSLVLKKPIREGSWERGNMLYFAIGSSLKKEKLKSIALLNVQAHQTDAGQSQIIY